MPASVKSDILHNLREYLAHELYFRSFGQTAQIPDIVKKRYSSLEGFLYEMYLIASKKESGFVFVFLEDNGELSIVHSNDVRRVKAPPRIALDISEHAYFLDYRFEKDRYLRSALSNLNFSLLDNLIK